jgi:hypothetical protein
MTCGASGRHKTVRTCSFKRMVGSFYRARFLHPLLSPTLSPSTPPSMRGGMRTILSLAFMKNTRKFNQSTSASALGMLLHDLQSQSESMLTVSHPFQFLRALVSALAYCAGHRTFPLVSSPRWASLIRAGRFAGLRIVIFPPQSGRLPHLSGSLDLLPQCIKPTGQRLSERNETQDPPATRLRRIRHTEMLMFTFVLSTVLRVPAPPRPPLSSVASSDVKSTRFGRFDGRV